MQSELYFGCLQWFYYQKQVPPPSSGSSFAVSLIKLSALFYKVDPLQPSLITHLSKPAHFLSGYQLVYDVSGSDFSNAGG